MASSSFLCAAPEGFSKAVLTLNRLPLPLVRSLVHDTADFLQRRREALPVAQYAADATAAGQMVSERGMQDAVNAALYMFREARRVGVKGDELATVLNRHTHLTLEVSRTFGSVWHEKGCLATGEEVTLGVGELTGVEWKLGVALQSSDCRTLTTPFVTLVLRVAGEDGTIVPHTLELTLPEFQHLVNSFQDIANVLETL